MNILFVHTWANDERIKSSILSPLLSYPSLTLPTLVSLVPDDVDAKIDVCDEKSQKLNYDAKKYDVVAVSFDTSSSLRAYEHAAQFKSRGSYILFGGYHTSAMPDEALMHADSIIIGAGEVSLPLFFHDYYKGSPQKIYNNQKIDVRSIKYPARNVLKKSKYLSIPAVIADRGCNNRCKFCSISRMWRSKVQPAPCSVSSAKHVSRTAGRNLSAGMEANLQV